MSVPFMLFGRKKQNFKMLFLFSNLQAQVSHGH